MIIHRCGRSGFVLLTILWVIVGVATVALAAALAARRASAAARHRVAIIRSTWEGEGCAAWARAVIADALAADSALALERPRSWATLDRVVAESRILRHTGCDMRLRAVGAALDLSVADEELLHALLASIHVPRWRADSLVDALLDWQDADDIPRPRGAEREWYLAHGRLPPRNGPLADRRELALVRGFEPWSQLLDSLVDVEPGRVALSHAPMPVLAALPGMSAELIAKLAAYRARGEPLPDLRVMAGDLSTAASSELRSRYADLTRLSTVEPDGWVLTSRAATAVDEPVVVVELRLARASQRAIVVRHRVIVR